MRLVNLFQRVTRSKPLTVGRGPNGLRPDERRDAIRRRQWLVEGCVSWDRMLRARRLRILDISPLGAKVQFYEGDSPNSRIPKLCRLHIFPDRLNVECEVVWRRGLEAGLRFKGEHHKENWDF